MDPLRNLGFLLKDGVAACTRSISTPCHGLELDHRAMQGPVLLAAQRGDLASPSRILTDTDPMTLVRILDRMEGDELIERRSDPSDGRARRLYLRPAAHPLLRRSGAWRTARAPQSFSRMSAQDRAQLLSLMQQMYAQSGRLDAGCNRDHEHASGQGSGKRASTPARTGQAARAHPRVGGRKPEVGHDIRNHSTASRETSVLARIVRVALQRPYLAGNQDFTCRR